MCGIIGYVGERTAAPILLQGLRRLEYRGYDSAGIATIDSELHIEKDIGKLDNVDFHLDQLKGKIGIAHTRWATHGGVTKENAHPHVSNNGKIVVVHNGIIENYQELRDFLISNGFKFYSQTDTEIFPNLIQYFMQENDYANAIKKTIEKIEGSYALVIMNTDLNTIIAVRKESPLVVGVGDNEYFVASDIPAFLEHTKKVIYLAENDIAVIGNGVAVYNSKLGLVKRPIASVEWDPEQAEKGEFEHFMLKEISEQADVISRAINQNKEVVEEIADSIKKAKGIFFVGCGTAYHACLSASAISSLN